MEGRELPRPPRRVPTGAGSLTQLDSSTTRGAQPPPRQPWLFGRILAGFIVLLIIVAGGATAGWWLRSQSVHRATPEVTDTTGPEVPETVGQDVMTTAGQAVVRVLATTCAGTGEGSGVLLEDGLILTATSAVEEPLSIVIVTPDNRIRPANLLGTSPDGVAVMQLIGSLDGERLSLAPGEPDPKAERALIGYTAAGKQVMNPIGSAAEPKALSEVMNATKLGSPVVDKTGRVVGLVVGDTVRASTIVPLEKLRGYAAPRSAGITAAAGGSCEESRGPQTPIAPELQVANTALAAEVQKLLGTYMTLENRRAFAALQPWYSEQLARSITPAKDQRSHRTTYFFGPKITEVSRNGRDGAYARVTFNALFSPVTTGADGRRCNRLDFRYRLVREGGKLVIDTAASMADPQSCETD
jgi:Trypsin-like peptidase domain